jgi:hypothetical protein
LNVQAPGGIRQTESHTAELFVSEPIAAEVEVSIKELKKYKSPDSAQFPAELIQPG